MLKAPSSCTSLLLTPDGGTVVCATQVSYPIPTSSGGCGTNGPMLVAYSAATGQRLRVLYQYKGACDQGVDTVLWSDDSARHVVSEQELFQDNPPEHTDRYGVAAAGNYTKFPVAPLGQWSSGPAF